MIESAIKIRQIQYHSDEYAKELELRDEVLRKPLGMSLYDENLEKEKQDVHVGAFLNAHLVGVLILTPLNPNEMKMRQVAVTETARFRKVGSELVHFAEEYCTKNGFMALILNARKTAVGFYEKLGYEKIGEEFLEINIPHFKMRKYL